MGSCCQGEKDTVRDGYNQYNASDGYNQHHVIKIEETICKILESAIKKKKLKKKLFDHSSEYQGQCLNV